MYSLSLNLVVVSPNSPEAMTKFAAECRELKIPYLYDPSQQILRLEGPELARDMEGAHFLFVNDYEFDLISKKTGFDLDANAATCGCDCRDTRQGRFNDLYSMERSTISRLFRKYASWIQPVWAMPSGGVSWLGMHTVGVGSCAVRSVPWQRHIAWSRKAHKTILIPGLQFVKRFRQAF